MSEIASQVSDDRWIRYVSNDHEIETCSPEKSMEYWSTFYRASPGDHVYDQNIKFDPDEKYTAENIRQLMIWKAGSNNQNAGIRFADNVPVEELNLFKRSVNETTNQSELWSYFKTSLAGLTVNPETSYIWPLFALHLAAPNNVPIYDRHAWRAYRLIHGLATPQNFISTAPKDDLWLYVDWVLHIERTVTFPPRTLDRGLWGFGLLWEKTAKQVKDEHVPQRDVAVRKHPGLFAALKKLWDDGMRW